MTRLLRSRWAPVLGILALWIIVWSVTKGTNTLALPGRDHTPLHTDLGHFRDDMLAGRSTNPLMQFTGWLSGIFRDTVTFLQHMVSTPNFPRPVPEIGWLGVTALSTWVAYAVANWRIALLTLGTFVSYGLFGFWQDSLDLLIIVGLSVVLSVIIGLPLAVLTATNKRFGYVMETILDLMQTMPTFVYLLPLVLFFGIGASGAVVCTLVYAVPPLIRIGAHGIRSVNPAMIEVTNSLGQTRWQRLLKVQLPLAKKTIIVGLNQTIMAALSMATIASFVDGPGLGKPVLAGLTINDVGRAFVPGALIVLTAIMLDRMTTAASEREENVARSGGRHPWRKWILLGGLAGVAVAIWLSRYSLWAASFTDIGLGRALADGTNTVTRGIIDVISPVTEALKNLISAWALDPLQSLLAESPWWLAALGILGVAYALGGRRVLIPTVICEFGIWYFDLWHDAMITLAMTLIGVALVMILAVLLGVAMARRRTVDLVVRPLLDAGQTIPPFVYLIPVLALFGPTRFTAIVAGLVYAAPVSIKLVADGVAAVSASTMEAARSTGATTRQQITLVQLPMAKPSLVLAANQGLLYVLAMAVIGGMVGAGALGYDVVLGFSRSEEWGKGFAAGMTIVLLGIMLDRITRAAAAKVEQEVPQTVDEKPAALRAVTA
ncbi:MAG TPA: ABC transporter permease subunit [Phycicoccus sp.]|jgi:glycine betaine/proline transport system permease protein|nr:ABC transporter permease subunit [Phycicoccus sp.]